MKILTFAAVVIIALVTTIGFPPEAAARSNHVDSKEVKWKKPTGKQYGPEFKEAYQWKTLVGGKHVPTKGKDVYFGEAEWAPGAIYVGHKHPAPEIYYVISGEAEWTIDGKTFKAGPGTAIYTKPNAVHRMVNVGDGVLKTIWVWWAPKGKLSELNKPSKRVEPIEKQPAEAKFPDGKLTYDEKSTTGAKKAVEQSASAEASADVAQPTPQKQERTEADIKKAAEIQSQDGATAPPYRIAIFPPGSPPANYLGKDKQYLESVTTYIQGNDLLALTYSYFSDPGDSVKKSEVWINPKKLNLEGVLAHARKLDVQGVVMGSLIWRGASRGKLEHYVIDINQATVITTKGELHKTTSMVQESFSGFISAMRVASQAQ